MNVLFIDDDHAINRYHQIVFGDLAAKRNISLSFYHDPIKVLKLLEEGHLRPDLIFLDINMPIIDGWEFLEQYNERGIPQRATIVILTTSADPHYVDRAMRTGLISDYKVKPLEEPYFEGLIGQLS